MNKKISQHPSGASGISLKRNTAIKNYPQADYYACIDSDAYPHPDWLDQALVHFQKDKDLWIVGGPDISPDYASLKKQSVAKALKSIMVSGPRNFMKVSKTTKYVDDLRTCNFIFTNEACKQISGFNEDFPVGEDSAFCQKAMSYEKKILFVKEVIVYHHNRSLFFPYFKQKITAGYGVPFLASQFKESMSFISKSFRYLPVVTIFFLFLGWTIPPFFKLWLFGFLLYGLLCIVETVRFSHSLWETPLTLVAVVTGNLLPGVGIMMKYLNIKLYLEKFYKNY